MPVKKKCENVAGFLVSKIVIHTILLYAVVWFVFAGIFGWITKLDGAITHSIGFIPIAYILPLLMIAMVVGSRMPYFISMYFVQEYLLNYVLGVAQVVYLAFWIASFWWPVSTPPSSMSGRALTLWIILSSGTLVLWIALVIVQFAIQALFTYSRGCYDTYTVYKIPSGFLKRLAGLDKESDNVESKRKFKFGIKYTILTVGNLVFGFLMFVAIIIAWSYALAGFNTPVIIFIFYFSIVPMIANQFYAEINRHDVDDMYLVITSVLHAFSQLSHIAFLVVFFIYESKKNMVGCGTIVCEAPGIGWLAWTVTIIVMIHGVFDIVSLLVGPIWWLFFGFRKKAPMVKW